jgi:hypothetical protein
MSNNVYMSLLMISLLAGFGQHEVLRMDQIHGALPGSITVRAFDSHPTIKVGVRTYV